MWEVSRAKGLAAWRSPQREALPLSSPRGTGHTVTWRPRGLAELLKRLLDLRTGDVGLGLVSVTVSHCTAWECGTRCAGGSVRTSELGAGGWAPAARSADSVRGSSVSCHLSGSVTFAGSPGTAGRSGAGTHKGTAALLAEPSLVCKHCLPARGPRCPGQHWGCQGELHSRHWWPAPQAVTPSQEGARHARCWESTRLDPTGMHGGREELRAPCPQRSSRSGGRPTGASWSERAGPRASGRSPSARAWPFPTTVRFGSG